MTKEFSKKKAITSIFASGILVLFLGLTLACHQKDINFKVSVQGTNGDFTKKELKFSEFAEMEITTNFKNIEVGQFVIFLARGNRPIFKDKVNGNNFDLERYSKNVRDGDRILIHNIELTPSLNESVEFSEGRGIEMSDQNIELVLDTLIITINIDFDK